MEYKRINFITVMYL